LKRYEAEILAFVALTSALVSALSLLGEQRVDAYVSVAILSYYVATSVASELRSRSKLLPLDVSLLLLFSYIVAIRILEVLALG